VGGKGSVIEYVRGTGLAWLAMVNKRKEIVGETGRELGGEESKGGKEEKGEDEEKGGRREVKAQGRGQPCR